MTEFWKNISIAKRLYFVVGIMAFLIAGELLTLRFAMRTLSAARAFVEGEGLWSKAQKDAVLSLQRYGQTKNEKDYNDFLFYLKVPEGDHQARLELSKKDPNLEMVRLGFLAGRIHPDDIEPMIELLQRFYWISFLSRAIDYWGQADLHLSQLKEQAEIFHDAVQRKDFEKANKAVLEVKKLNQDLTSVEEGFSFSLGQGSRWLEHIVLSMLTFAVLIVESIGLSLAFFTSRAISRGLNDLNRAAHRIGAGDFNSSVEVKSKDEIGQLGNAVNTMGALLQKSYTHLEKRVQERTNELEKLAAENSNLYEEAKKAVEMRDEFLSIASHELRTPLTALFIQLQRISHYAEKMETSPENKNFFDMANMSVKLARRITILLDELLDLTRIRIGKFELHLENCDLVPGITEVVSQLSADASRAGSQINFKTEASVRGAFDSNRISQVATNLLSNAIKYGNGKPITVSLRKSGTEAVLEVKDHGIGIPPEQISKIFERFERGEMDSHISGLGLGLYISHQIVKAHKGTISVESVVHEGSTFTVKI